jgi:hypothetical protein
VKDDARGRQLTVTVVAALDLTAKALLLAMVLLSVADPTWGNLEGKAPTQRAVLYPIVAVLVPALYGAGYLRRGRSYPWSADLLLTLIGFSDVLGNRLNLFDEVLWFDDGMHLAIGALVGAAVLLLTTDRGTRFMLLVERSLAVVTTVSLAWELWEYFSFVVESREFAGAYSDTIGDFSLGWLGAVLGAVLVWLQRRVSRGPGAVRRRA